MMGVGSGMAPASLLAVVIFAALVAPAVCTLAEKQKAPSISVPAVASETYYRLGSKVVLMCKASGNPPPMYQWYWNGKAVTANTRQGIVFDAVSGNLTIRSISNTTQGRFKCSAQNTFLGVSAIAISPEVQIGVAGIGELWEVDTDNKAVKASEGSYAKISCDKKLPVIFGPFDFKWLIVRGKDQYEIPQDKRRFIDSKGTLHFTYLNATLDELPSNDNYACAVSSATSGKISAGSKKKLIVTKNDKIANRPPKREYFSGNNVTFEAVGSAKLECLFSGFYRVDGVPQPSPTIRWYDAGNKLIVPTIGRYVFQHEGRVLNILDLKESDEGNYYCKGVNGEGEDQGVIYLNVTSPPIWVHRLADMTVVQGRDARFSCDARSAAKERDPDPPMWYKNGIRLDLNPDVNKYVFEDGNRAMTVKAVQRNLDIACFQCNVSNSVGHVFLGGCLNIILPIVIVSKPPEMQVISEGDLVNLTVVATSDPSEPLKYRWIFKGKTYVDPVLPPYVKYDKDTKLTYINTTNFTSAMMHNISGHYQLEVYHALQTEVVHVNVTLKEGPTPAPAVVAGFDYWIIGLIIGILLIIIVIIIICCVICRRKMLEGDYPVDRKETAAGLDPEKEAADSGFHDLSRADYDMPEKKSPNMDFDDQIPLHDDESFGSAEYAEEDGNFNENGSFIGIYTKGKKPEGPPGYNSAESKV